MQEIPYQFYLDQQIQRTLGKIDVDPSPRTVYLLSKLARYLPSSLNLKVLCVGCRNNHELNRFEEFGCKDIIGIDLHSNDPRIRVMDMHYLEFSNSTFDIIYCSHTLENALDPEKAAYGFERVVKPGGCIVIEVSMRIGEPSESTENVVTVKDREGNQKIVPVGSKGLQPNIWEFSEVTRLSEMFPNSKVAWKEVGPSMDNPGQTVIRMILRRGSNELAMEDHLLQPVNSAKGQVEGLRGLIEKLSLIPKRPGSPPPAPIQLKSVVKEPAIEPMVTNTPAILVHPTRIPHAKLSPDCGNINYSQRRYFVDEFYTRRVSELPSEANVLDMGGKKEKKRGQFNIERYGFKVQYANLDKETNPDFFCDLAAIPVPTSNFDCAILAEVAEHLLDPDSVLKEASRVLKSGGVLLATAPFMFRIHPDPLDIARYTPQWWEEHLNRVGFSEIEIEPQGLFFSTMADLLRDWAMFTEDRQSFIPGIKEGALLALQSFREFALKIEELPQTKSHPFYPSLSTGFGIKAKKR